MIKVNCLTDVLDIGTEVYTVHAYTAMIRGKTEIKRVKVNKLEFSGLGKDLCVTYFGDDGEDFEIFFFTLEDALKYVEEEHKKAVRITYNLVYPEPYPKDVLGKIKEQAELDYEDGKLTPAMLKAIKNWKY